MQFTISYIKALSSVSGNVPNIPEENENQEFNDIDTLLASVNSLVSQTTIHSSYSLETPHTCRSVSDSASITHIPQYECLEPCTSENSQITARDKYYNVVKETFTENYEPYNPHQSLQYN